MKYLFITILILIIFLIIVFISIKKASQNSNSVMPNTKQKKELTKDDIYSKNPNPSFEVTLIDYKQNQISINNSFENESVYFKLDKDKRIKVYTINKKYIGKISIKDYKLFDLISLKPEYFEGIIIGYQTVNRVNKKVIINTQVKEENSIDVYKINTSYLNTLITLKAMFEKNEIINTSYGPSTIIEVYDNYLLVDVPSLGTREIYDIQSIINGETK